MEVNVYSACIAGEGVLVVVFNLPGKLVMVVDESISDAFKAGNINYKGPISGEDGLGISI